MASSLKDAEEQDLNECMAVLAMIHYAETFEREKSDPKSLSGEDRKWQAEVETAAGVQTVSDWDGVG